MTSNKRLQNKDTPRNSFTRLTTENSLEKCHGLPLNLSFLGQLKCKNASRLWLCMGGCEGVASPCNPKWATGLVLAGHKPLAVDMQLLLFAFFGGEKSPTQFFLHLSFTLQPTYVVLIIMGLLHFSNIKGGTIKCTSGEDIQEPSFGKKNFRKNYI